MAIIVVCPGCRKRFQVSDQFAGKKGPCPKCKAEITIPKKSEEVVVHAPEQYGPKTTQGAAVFKPIAREETRFSPLTLGVVLGGILVSVGIAWMFRSTDPQNPPPIQLLLIGAIALAPPLVWGGYTLLRDQELEPHRGRAMWVRVGICSVFYALLWGLFAWITFYLFGNDPLQITQLAYLVPPLVAAGGLVAFSSMDLDYGTAMIHYGFYLGVTVMLRLVLGLSAFGY
jgi:hypothetical protein